MLIAGAVHFAVFVEVADVQTSSLDTRYLSTRPSDRSLEHPGRGDVRFEAVQRRRFVSSVQEVVGSEGLQVISNEVFRLKRDGRTDQAAPLRSSTLEDLIDCGFEPSLRGTESVAW